MVDPDWWAAWQQLIGQLNAMHACDGEVALRFPGIFWRLGYSSLHSKMIPWPDPLFLDGIAMEIYGVTLKLQV